MSFMRVLVVRLWPYFLEIGMPSIRSVSSTSKRKTRISVGKISLLTFLCRHCSILWLLLLSPFMPFKCFRDCTYICTVLFLTATISWHASHRSCPLTQAKWWSRYSLIRLEPKFCSLHLTSYLGYPKTLRHPCKDTPKYKVKIVLIPRLFVWCLIWNAKYVKNGHFSQSCSENRKKFHTIEKVAQNWKTCSKVPEQNLSMPIPNKFISGFTISDSFFEISGKIVNVHRSRSSSRVVATNCLIFIFCLAHLLFGYASANECLNLGSLKP